MSDKANSRSVAVTSTAVTSDTLAEMARAIVDAVHPEPIIVFGSHARGEARPDRSPGSAANAANDIRWVICGCPAHLSHRSAEREIGMIRGSGTATSSSSVTSRPNGAL